MKIWIVQYWMPPQTFLTWTAVCTTREEALRYAWDEVLHFMHSDGWNPVVHPATDYFPDPKARPAVRAGFVVAPVRGDDPPRALVLITEEEVL